MTPVGKKLPLEGIRALAFTHAVMGPAAGLMLADLGAEVILIEPPTGDPTRILRGFGIGYFSFFNRNKKCLAVDLKAPEGRKVILKLVETADILLENFGPGTMDRLGYDYETLSKINPRLIYCSLKGFLPGPYENRVAMDEVVQIMGGLAYMTGPPGQPLRAGTSVVDINGGMFGVMGILVALYDRERTGKGTFVTSALFETVVFLMGQHMAYAALTNEPVPPMPARVSAWSVYKLFETKDGEQVFVGIISEKHWQQFCEAFGRMDWFQDERLKTNNSRIGEREWFIPEVEKMIKKYTKQEIIDICDKAGICFAPIVRPEDLFEDPQLNQGSSTLLETTFPSGVKTKMPRLPFQVGDYDFKKRNDPPAVIGANTSEILNSIGYTSGLINELAEKKVIAVGD
ncbi:MAG: CaiB/BaiF CoA-transferase family protein [Thermodesulfobacteriota bacterium]|nr:CaiB/BaiF CoA-transferase family protein [Thermodesulfobacteriota bacterium]